MNKDERDNGLTGINLALRRSTSKVLVLSFLSPLDSFSHGRAERLLLGRYMLGGEGCVLWLDPKILKIV